MHHVQQFICWFPRRLHRVLAQLRRGLRGGNPLHWWSDFVFLCADLLGVFDAYDGLSQWLKRRTLRPLDERETALARSVFGPTLPLRRVRLDARARIACRNRHLCYVSFHTINSWGRMTDATLIHELVHVWQYRTHGAAYIPRALRAYHSTAGYNYGGVGALLRARAAGQTLLDFNYEQQADIIADAFRLRTGRQPRWGNATPTDLPIYARYVDDLRGMGE